MISSSQGILDLQRLYFRMVCGGRRLDKETRRCDVDEVAGLSLVVDLLVLLCQLVQSCCVLCRMLKNATRYLDGIRFQLKLTCRRGVHEAAGMWQG